MKTVITIDIIKTELKKIYLHDIIRYGAILLLCVAYLVLYFFKPQLSIYNPQIFVLLLCPLFVFLIVFSIINLYKTFKACFLTRNNKIDIVTDVLVDKRKKAQLSRYKGYHHTYTFIFEKSQEYNLEKRIIDVSNPYNIDNEQLYETSEIYDKFYIVSVGKQESILAYNQRFFELKEEK